MGFRGFRGPRKAGRGRAEGEPFPICRASSYPGRSRPFRLARLASPRPCPGRTGIVARRQNDVITISASTMLSKCCVLMTSDQALGQFARGIRAADQSSQCGRDFPLRRVRCVASRSRKRRARSGTRSGWLAPPGATGATRHRADGDADDRTRIMQDCRNRPPPYCLCAGGVPCATRSRLIPCFVRIRILEK